MLPQGCVSVEYEYILSDPAPQEREKKRTKKKCSSRTAQFFLLQGKLMPNK